MSRFLKWLLAVIVTGGLAALGAWAFLAGRQEMAREREMDQPIKAPSRVSHSAEGQEVITLDPPTQERVGLKTVILAGVSLQPQVVAYGTLQEDPAQAFVIRSPVAGTLRTVPGKQWPGIGDVLPDGAVVGGVEPRFTAMDQVDLASKLASARADVDATTASLAVDRADYERLKKLNVQAQVASDRAVQEAQAKMKGDEARLQAATEARTLLEAALAGKAGASGSRALRLDQGGQVVELPVQPGEAIESGQPLLKVARFDKLLASVTVPLGEKVDPAVATARIVVSGFENHVLPAECVAVAPVVDSKTLGQAFLFRIADGKLALRPGMAVTAYLPTTGSARKGVDIPRSAIIRYAGRGWAYMQQGDTFSRREVALDEPTALGWFVTSGWQEGQRIVVAGAQVLLSEELKSQIQITQ